MNKIYILYGAPSREREVSLRSKDYFLELLKEFNPVLVDWTEDNFFQIEKNKYSLEDFLTILKQNKALVVNSIHGDYGEDGYIQEILALNNIAFTGSDAFSCMVSINKYESNNAVKDIVNIIPTYKTLPKNFNLNICNKYIGEKFPIFAKPNASGSSVGVYKIHDKAELNRILELLPDIDYLFQPSIEGVEVSIGCVRFQNSFLDLPPTEIIPKTEFFDYEAKYSEGGSEEITPARISPNLTNKLKDLSRKIHEKLELGYYSRTDFRINFSGDIYYLETNTLPGMSSASILPQQLKYSNNINKFKDGLIKNIINKNSLNDKKYDVPYTSQTGIPENNDITSKEEWLEITSGLEESGADTLSDFHEFADSLCGVSCIKMILEFFKKDNKKLFEVFYDLRNSHLEDLKTGLNYENIHKYFDNFKLITKIYRTGFTLDEICFNISKGKLCVVSIKPLNSIVNSKEEKGGHLVLITGYDLNKQIFYLNDPGGSFEKNEYKDRVISFEEFRKVYSYRGFSVGEEQLRIMNYELRIKSICHPELVEGRL
ncbi:MAG: C39 family peptidase [bacterium]